VSDDEEGSDQALPPPFRELSYEVHTNRELEFMLDGRKPLAHFSDFIFDDHDPCEPREGFERQVESGAFVKHEAQELGEPFRSNGRLVKGIMHRFYALEDEAWRIPAYLLLKKVQDKHPWNDALESLEGSLLGYTDEQNDEWLAKLYERHAGWACVTLYATTTVQILDEVAELGNRAFPKEILKHASLFAAERIPTRASLEKAGLFSGKSRCHLVRFGVAKEFFFDGFECTPSGDLTLVSIHKDVSAKDLNRALRTEIQIIDLG